MTYFPDPPPPPVKNEVGPWGCFTMLGVFALVGILMFWFIHKLETESSERTARIRAYEAELTLVKICLSGHRVWRHSNGRFVTFSDWRYQDVSGPEVCQ